MDPTTHMKKRPPNKANISLSSFLSKVLLLEGTFIEFIITCSKVDQKYKQQLYKETIAADKKRDVVSHSHFRARTNFCFMPSKYDGPNNILSVPEAAALHH